MLGYFIILLALTVLCNGYSTVIKESFSCRDSQTNEVCVGHQLECDEGKEIYVLNGHYIYSKTDSNCSSLPNGNCLFDKRSYCSLDYITSDMSDAISECNGLRSCSPQTPRRASSSSCVKYRAYRFPSFHYYTLSYLSYTCIPAPMTIRIDENIETTRIASYFHVVVMGNINRNTVCSLRVDHSVDFVFIQSNKEKEQLRYLHHSLHPLHRYVVKVHFKYTPHYFKMNFRGPLTDLKINLTRIGWPTRDLWVTTYCSMETATSRGPNPNHETTTNPYPRPFSSSTSTPIWSTTTNGWDKWTDIVDSDGDEIEELFKTTEHPKNEPKTSTTEHPKSETKASTISNEYKIALGVGLFAFIAFCIILSVVVIVLKRKALARQKSLSRNINGFSNPIHDQAMYGEPIVSFNNSPQYYDHIVRNDASGYDSLPPSYSKATGASIGSISDAPTYSNAAGVSYIDMNSPK